MFDRRCNGLHERHKPMCQDWRCQSFQRADQQQSIFRLRLKLVTRADLFLFSFEKTHSKIISNYKQKMIKRNLQQRALFSSSAFTFDVKAIWTNDACASHPFLLYDFVYVLYLCVLLVYRAYWKFKKEFLNIDPTRDDVFNICGVLVIVQKVQ